VPESLLPFVPLPPLLGFLLLALAPFALRPAVARGAGIAAGATPALLLAWLLPACATGEGCAAGAVLPIMTVATGMGGTTLALAVSFDPLSLLAGTTVAAVGALVLLYAGSYMAEEPPTEQRRFFALMDLFLAGMLAVVLAADTVLLFLGWEIIGLCSFFLISFYTGVPKAVAAGRKALVMTRAADTMLLSGLILLFLRTGTTRFDGMLTPPTDGGVDWPLALIAALTAGGALGKSAQIPFQAWLPSAMTGPTPVSALLHSATMVAAGVILLARLSPMLAAVPEVSAGIAVIAAATAVLAALAGVVQRDVKRMLAWSTISQIGVMMLALGVGAPDAAMAHFTVHAAFKSLLFLAAGVMSHAAHGSTAIADLRGAMRRQPLAFWCFAAGAASLAGLPVVTAGWFSKEAVLAAVWASGPWGGALAGVAILTAMLTATYAFRVVFVAASPTADRPSSPWGGPAVSVPLLVLAAVAIGGGVAVGALLEFMGGHGHHAMPPLAVAIGASAPILGAVFARALTLHPERLDRLGAALRRVGAKRAEALSYRIVVRRFRRVVHRLAATDAGEAGPIRRLRRIAPGLAGLPPGARIGRGPLPDPVGRAPVVAADRLVAALVAVVTPDRIDLGWDRTARALRDASLAIRRVQTGRARDYALALALGAAGLLLLAWGSTWH
jgi:NADH-quinone oxidoreductase subunit L